jgi:hypothetical protein
MESESAPGDPTSGSNTAIGIAFGRTGRATAILL